MMPTSLILPGEERVLDDPQTIREKLEHEIDLVIDGGDGGQQTTTVIDLTVVPAKVVREGLGVFEEN
jgi:tRNA A37 threonylcarbamoyladenosine synthetase subunit TsaC/SUA5/YrdC